jgi:hypothetical protein
MTSREVILESLIFGLEMAFLGCPVRLSRHPKKNSLTGLYSSVLGISRLLSGVDVVPYKNHFSITTYRCFTSSRQLMGVNDSAP